MNIALVVLEVLKAGLGLWQSKEKRKYIDRLMKLEKRLYEEEARPYDEKDMAVIGNIHFDLMLLARAFAQDAGSNTINK